MNGSDNETPRSIFSAEMNSRIRSELQQRHRSRPGDARRVFGWQESADRSSSAQVEDLADEAPEPLPFPDLGQGARGPARQPAPTFGQTLQAAIHWKRSGYDDPRVRDAFYPQRVHAYDPPDDAA